MSDAWPELVILAADDQQILPVVQRLYANVVVGVERIPDERVGHRSLGHAPGDRVSPVRQLLGVDRHPVVDRGVGREHGGARPDDAAIGRDFDPRFRLGVGQVRRVAVDPAAAREDRPGKPGQILRRVKPGLIGKAQSLAGIDAGNRGAVGPFDIDAYLPAGPVLLFESGAILQ